MRELANTAWAFAAVNWPDEDTLTASARVAQQQMGEFKPSDLANIAWAFATVEGQMKSCAWPAR